MFFFGLGYQLANDISFCSISDDDSKYMIFMFRRLQFSKKFCSCKLKFFSMTHLLDDRQKINALILHSHRIPLREIENRTGASKIHIPYLVNKFSDHGTVGNLWRNNPTFSFNREEIERIVNAVLANRSITVSEIKFNATLNPRDHSRSTICRVLRREGLKSRVQPRKFHLSQEHLCQRYQCSRS